MSRYTSLHAAFAATLACSAFLATPASALSTLNAWNGSQSIFSFGCPDTTTYGQVITTPAHKANTTLNHFTFKVVNAGGGDAARGAPPPSMVVRGEVYAWDGTKATGKPLWESKPRLIAYTDSAFHSLTFNAPAIPLTPGSQYVIFASVAEDYALCNNYTLGWGSVADTTYAGGTFVYQNNGGDASQWTSTDWTTSYGQDLAFRAGIKSNTK